MKDVTVEFAKKESGDSLTILDAKILSWGYGKGIIFRENRFQQMAKVTEEVGEVAHALCRDNQESLRDSIGDTYVTLCLLAAQNGMSMQECVQAAYDEIKGRTGKLKDGVFVKD